MLLSEETRMNFLLPTNKDYNTCQPLSADQKEYKSIEVFPNPAYNRIELHNASQVDAVALISSSGQLKKGGRYRESYNMKSAWKVLNQAYIWFN